MTPVEFHFVSPTGEPIVETEIQIQLSRAGYDAGPSGIVMPRPVLATTDSDGRVTVYLWPSQILYHVTVDDPVSEAQLHYKFYVPLAETPNQVVRLQDIVVDGVISNTSYDEAAILQIHASKASALAAAAEANNTLPFFSPTPQSSPKAGWEWIDSTSGRRYHWLVDADSGQWVETGAVVSIGFSTHQAVLTALTAADAAEDSVVDATAQVSLAQAQVVLAQGQVAAATTWADAAEASATLAEAKRVATEALITSDWAVDAQTAATASAASATTAAGHVTTAAGHVTTAAGHKDAAAASATSAAASAAITAAEALNATLTGLSTATNSPVVAADSLLVGVGKLQAQVTAIPTPAPAPDLTAYAPKANPTFTGTVAGVTKTHVGLANVDNTNDAAKPISTAAQTALNAKANLASPTFTGTVGGVTKAMVGLGSVDNVSDVNKPVSTAQGTRFTAVEDRVSSVETRVTVLETGASTSGGGTSPSSQPITASSLPKYVADGATLKEGVPSTRVSGVYSAGSVTSRYRTRGTTVVAGGDQPSYTHVAADVGQMMSYYETVTNTVTGEVKTFASAAVGPILAPDPTTPGEVQSFDFTTGTAHPIAVTRSGTVATRRSAAATVAVMAANTKRYEFNAAGAQIGLLCEKASNNFFANAKNMAAVVVASGGGVVTANYGVAPDGTTTSTRVVAAAGAASKGATIGIFNITAAIKQQLWVKGASGQLLTISDADSGEYISRGPTTGAWQLIEDQGTAIPGSNYLNFRVFNEGVSALDIQVWGGALQPGSGYQSIILSDGTNLTRPKEVWSVTLAAANITRDIQIEDYLGQKQNFTDQVIGANALWAIDAVNVTIAPVIAKLRVYTPGSITASPPAAPPPATPPPSAPAPTGGAVMSMTQLIDYMEMGDDATKWGGYPPARQASMQTPVNNLGIKYICEYPRTDGKGNSNFYNEWDSIPLWLWIFLSDQFTATGKRIQYRNMQLCILLDSPTGQWVSSAIHNRVGSYQNTQLWEGTQRLGAPTTRLQAMQRDESDANGGGSSVVLSGNEGVEMWANPGFYALKDRSIMARAFSGAAIAEIRVINENGTVYTGTDAKPLAALGGDMYAPNVQNPNLSPDGLANGIDGFKGRWKRVDCSGGWQPVGFVGVDFCFKKDGPRPPWGNYTGSWNVTNSTYNLTKAQLQTNPPPFIAL